MACSRFEYVKRFEQHATLLPGCWAVVRLDGRGFTRFCAEHGYAKPNDRAGLALMNAAAAAVLAELPDMLLAFGHSDEFSFVLRRGARLFARRADKILSVTATLFAAEFVRCWPACFPATPLRRPPAFDARVVLYPTTAHLRDYLSWRQADVHVNNLFNTAFWALIRAGRSQAEAEKELRGTSSAQKNELLHEQHGINYNNEAAIFRKGSLLLRKSEDIVVDHTEDHQSPDKEPRSAEEASQAGQSHARPAPSKLHLQTSTLNANGGGCHKASTEDAQHTSSGTLAKCSGEPLLGGTASVGEDADDANSLIRTLHIDIIRDEFWRLRPHLLPPSDENPPRG